MRRIPLALALFLVFQALYVLTASGRVNRVADEFEVYLQAESLIDRGSQAIPQAPPDVFFGRMALREAPRSARCAACTWRREGDLWRCAGCAAGALPYAPYGPLTAFTALPHHLLGRGVAAAAGVPRTDVSAWTELVAAFTSLATATWAALAVLALFRAARALGASERRAALLAGLLGAGTALWPYGTVFFGEAQAAACFAWAVTWLLEGKHGRAAVTVTALLLIKVAHFSLVPPLLALALVPRVAPPGDLAQRARSGALQPWLLRAAPLAIAVTVAGLVHVAWNEHRFGRAFDFGYGGDYLRPGEATRPFILAALPRGLAVLLLSPGKSVLLFAPPLLLAVARLPGLARDRAGRPLLVAWAAGLGASLLYYGAYLYPEGGYCFGPRYLVPLLPLLLLPLATGPAPRRWAVAVCLALGMSVQALGVTVSYLEDQAEGIATPAEVAAGEANRSVYYEVSPPDDLGIPPGRPLNVYRLGYSPLVTYPRLLLEHLTQPRAESGLDLLWLHVARLRARGLALPRWPFVALLALAGAALAAGAGAVRAHLRGSPAAARSDDEEANAAGALPRSSDPRL